MTASNYNGPRPAQRHVYSYVAQPQLYSDHYPDHQNSPNGIISIAFSKSTIRGVHTNNDQVRGVVHVKSNIKVKTVSIRFVGRSTCRTLDGTSQQFSSTELFCHEKVLRKIVMPSENCPPNRIEYPFEFRFPEAVQLPSSIPCPAESRFEHEPGHSLPPSLWWDESTVRNEYILEAQFVSDERHFTMNPKVVQQLRFFPSVPETGLPDQALLQPAPPLRIERRVPRPEPCGRGRGALQRLSRRISGSTESLHEPVSSDLLILSAPKHYRVGLRSVLKFSLQSVNDISNERAAPVCLRGIRAQAIACIEYRIPTPSHISPTSHLIRSGESKFDLFNRRYAIPGLHLDTATPTEVEAFEIRKLVPPTFKTYNVALKYDVKYDILLECGGKESEHEVTIRNVAIKPMTRPGGWLGPPPDDGAHEERLLLAELMRENMDAGTIIAEIERFDPPAYEP
ncbi:hypothetical protein N0V91_008015 [Didymella pomorum]|jgi:hypothetical protein|uniref:Arrestin-like N-terminal domain-containing protein n=1 Tax=Didymella pomorum TaxID=749634 RepID=A0A9W8ZBS4_9PLEO|nr:hypothetical protein N0V91_008015 [Didymella pomorum]